MIEISLVAIQKTLPKNSSSDVALRDAAQKLEASFLAEEGRRAVEGWGGGVGEDQFASFLRQAQAEEMARSGGIGLSESLFEALKERADV